jgi:hypothetical protein
MPKSLAERTVKRHRHRLLRHLPNDAP